MDGIQIIERIDFFLQNFSKEGRVFFLAMLPVSELRGSIPLGFFLNLPWQKVFFISILGNIFPIPFILILLEPVSKKLRRFRIWRRFFEWLFKRTQEKARIVERLEFWGLVFFVGIPLPMTGAWTGAIAASLFGMRFWLAFLAIFLGLVIAGIIVSLMVITGKMVVSLPFF